MADKTNRIGLISDTHGQLRKSAVDALTGVELILHAGDVDRPALLDELNRIAPVFAVRGNMDVMAGVNDLPEYRVVETSGIRIGVIHDRLRLKIDPVAEGLSVVVFGHSHRPVIAKNDGIYFINPGSAGPRRFRLPITLGLLEIKNGRLLPQIVDIET